MSINKPKDQRNKCPHCGKPRKYKYEKGHEKCVELETIREYEAKVHRQAKKKEATYYHEPRDSDNLSLPRRFSNRTYGE
jgi:hypothetical protein